MKIVALLLLLTLPCFGQVFTNRANVRAWGYNSNGQCNVPADITNAVGISAGNCFSVALMPDGTVRAWGRNDSGECNVPADVTNVMEVISATAANHSLALLSNRTLRAWGRNNSGQCNVPSDLTNVVAVAGGRDHSLALKSDGTIRAWGSSGYGVVTNVPPELTNVVGLASGFNHALALMANGSIRGWGYNDYGQCNPPADLTNAIAVAAGYNISLAVRADGLVRVWGEIHDNIPSGLTNVVSVGGGVYHYVALLANGGVRAWGVNTYGQTNVPTDVVAVRRICSGDYHSLALVDPGTGQVPPPILLGPPVPNSQTAPIGGSASISINVGGTPPFAYQWFFGLTNALSGATNKTLALHGLVTDQTGNYSVVVSNYGGSVTSTPSFLNVIPVVSVSLVPALELLGQVGRQYRIDYINAVGPTDAWNMLVTLTITNNPQTYFDVSAKGHPVRYYRLVQLP